MIAFLVNFLIGMLSGAILIMYSILYEYFKKIVKPDVIRRTMICAFFAIPIFLAVYWYVIGNQSLLHMVIQIVLGAAVAVLVILVTFLLSAVQKPGA